MACTLHNLTKIITDPIEGILRPTLRYRIYIIFAFAFSSGATAMTVIAELYGKSVKY